MPLPEANPLPISAPEHHGACRTCVGCMLPRSCLSALFEHTMEAVVITDTEGNILCVNDSFEKHTGYSRCAVVGKNPRILKSDRHNEGFYRGLWRTLKTGSTWRERVINRCRDGSLINVQQAISPIFAASGEITHFVSVWRNVTRESELLEMARKSQRLEHLGQLATEIAHDFNNALTGVRGFSELLLQIVAPDSTEASMLREIVGCGHRASRLAHQLLELGRQRGGNDSSTDLNMVITQMLPFLRSTLGPGVEVFFKPHWEALPVAIDSLQTEQILLNLCLNAKDAMPTGGKITIRSQEVLADPPDATGERRMVELSIADTGMGMTEHTLENLFHPFFTTKGDRDGTGLGLAIVQGIVDEVDGSVAASSELGQGSVFRVRLPVAGCCLPQQADDEGRELLHGTGHVLVVIHDPTIRQLTGQMLLHLGYTPVLVGDATTALELARELEPCEVVLVETDMPAMTGGQLVAALRECLPGIRAVLATADYSFGNRPHVPGSCLLQKPYGIAELAEAIHDVRHGDTPREATAEKRAHA